MNCGDHAERLAAVEVEVEHTKELVRDVHDDHENTKRELANIKATIAIWSTIGALIGSSLFNLIYDVNLFWLPRSIDFCKMVLGKIFPDSFAGN
jgi:hypothetical protein